MDTFYSRLTGAQKLRFFLACLIIPIRLILVVFGMLGEYADKMNDAIDIYGKKFIKGNKS